MQMKARKMTKAGVIAESRAALAAAARLMRRWEQSRRATISTPKR